MSLVDPILECESLVKTYKGPWSKGKRRNVDALHDVSLQVRAGATLGIVGESGSGKSTLGRLLINLETPTSGSVRFRGRELRGGGRREALEMRKQLQIVFQDPYESLNPRLRVGDALTEALEIQTRMTRRERRAKALDFLARVGLSAEDFAKFPHQFSGGQRQRVCIARALIVDPALVVCDEAVSALDVSIQASILELLGELQRDLGLTYVFISHDLGVIKNIADDVVVMQSGRVVERGTVNQIFASPQTDYTRELLDAAPIVDPHSTRYR
ncbi:ABC transporter ATP-binding protein [Microbacterium esteraromaticum]|uniref:ABC transporter ATP-binding protein n=1 Tax=Microbacterium esteraromaticum TaxID=57043 RepID=A0A939IUQ0_9MICO|nr:ABC transporter ATP-binding protein [Microbacterium esteraromaticum]MBN8415017.1 ABC transporter ATP-binding protein [Microbacterium esteraromaticum]